jgi:dTDP-4-dehydrorhamnose 3,5-epimerase
MFIETPIKDLLIFKPKTFSDERGYFAESFSQSIFEKAGLHYHWIQDNFSCSKKNVLRGLHFQKPPYEQAKLVSVLKGAAFDVAVDLRKNSKTFGQWFGLELNEKELKHLLIPKGFAHGFVCLEDNTHFCYKVDAPYNPVADSGIIYNDKDIGIQWPGLVSEVILSQKDAQLQTFKEFMAN